jgi:hypothetical protein
MIKTLTRSIPRNGRLTINLPSHLKGTARISIYVTGKIDSSQPRKGSAIELFEPLKGLWRGRKGVSPKEIRTKAWRKVW